MESKTQKKEDLEMQFQELVDMAKQLYPNIDDAVSILNNMTAQTTSLQDYLNLTNQTPSETSNNQISFT
jgi:glutaredoxin 2